MHERTPSTTLTAVCGAALAFAAGALVMYLMDPNTGRRRRALIRDRGASMGHEAERYVRGKTRRAAHHLKGVAARTRASLSSHHDDDDDVLHDRIRSRLGRMVRHPHDIEVRVSDGRVQLKGTVAEDEFRELLHTVASMRGVHNLESLLRTAPSAQAQPLSPH